MGRGVGWSEAGGGQRQAVDDASTEHSVERVGTGNSKPGARGKRIKVSERGADRVL